MTNRSTESLTSALAAQLRRLRIDSDLTQAQLAERANLGVSTIVGLERGAGTLTSFVRVLRALDAEDWLDTLAPESATSPMQQLLAARSATRPRQRVRARREPGGGH